MLRMTIEVTTNIFDLSRVKESIETSQLVYGNESKKVTANAPVSSRAYIENKHLYNPMNRSLVIQLVQKRKIRGHIFLIERCFVFNGEQHPILVASDLVSKADIPGASLIIFRKAMQYCKIHNIPLVNFSNKDSDKIYSQIMKIEPVIEIDFQVGYLNLKSLFVILNKQLNFQSKSSMIFITNKVKILNKNLEIRLIPQFDKTIDTFFEKLEKDNIFFGKRSSKILNWRFNPTNEIDYARILIFREEIVVGYLVVCERAFKGLKLLIIVDYVMWNLNTIEIYRIKKELKKAYPGAAACIWSSNLLHNNRVLGKFKGLTIPRRFSPERVKFYLSGGSEKFQMNLKKAHLTLFDTDIL
jgi:hypothetical protein